MNHSALVSRVALSAVLGVAGIAPAAAPVQTTVHWPQWRGPNRDAVSSDTGLLQTWGNQGPPLAWKSSGLGGGFASVVISDGRIFTMGKKGKDELLLALDGTDGHLLWSTHVGRTPSDIPSSTPTVDGDLVYALGPAGDLVGVECATGKELWRKAYTKDFGGAIPTWKFCESPLVDGDKLICTPGSAQATMVALNKKTGEVIWKCAIPNGGGGGGGYSSAVISAGAGVRQYVQLLGSGAGCVGVSAADGKLLWSYPRVSNGTASVPTPIVDGDYVFASSGYGTGAVLLQLSKAGRGVTAKEVYFIAGSQFQNHHGGMIRVGKYVYTGHGNNEGIPVCIDMKSGKNRWKGRGPGSGSAAVAYADGQLYFRYQNGMMALISAATDGYHLNGQFMIPEVKQESWSHPVVAGGKLYLREQDNLFVYDVKRK